MPRIVFCTGFLAQTRATLALFYLPIFHFLLPSRLTKHSINVAYCNLSEKISWNKNRVYIILAGLILLIFINAAQESPHETSKQFATITKMFKGYAKC